MLSIKTVELTSSRLQEEIMSGSKLEDSWNSCQVEAVQCAKNHAWYLTHKIFMEKITHLTESTTNQALQRLCSLMGLSIINDNIGNFIEFGFIDSTLAQAIRKNIRNLYVQLRPDAVALVDAFNFPDFMVSSTLGNYDGDIYKHHFDAVSTPLTKAFYWDELIAPSLAKL